LKVDFVIGVEPTLATESAGTELELPPPPHPAARTATSARSADRSGKRVFISIQ